MNEISERLHKNRQIERAKELLESVGYTVTEKVDEKLKEAFDPEKVKKRIAHTKEFDNGRVLHGGWKKMTLADSEEEAKKRSLEDPEKVFYVAYDNVMNSSSDKYWKNGQLCDYEGNPINKSSEMDESSTLEPPEGFKYINNVNGYQTYRKVENGKGVWLARHQDSNEFFPITYDQARGYEEIYRPEDDKDSETVRYVKRDLTRGILPSAQKMKDNKALKESIRKALSKKMRESSDTPHTEQYKGYSIQSYNDYGATIYKDGDKIQEFENIDDAREYIDGLFESTDEYGRPLAELPASDPLCAELRSFGITEKDISPVASSDKNHEYHGKSDFSRVSIDDKKLESKGYEYVDTNSSDYTSSSFVNFEKGYMITLVASSTGYVHIQKLGPNALKKIKSGTFDFWNDRYSE